jgi:hypothetical protein
MALLFDQGDELSKEVWVGQEWKPKLWSRGCQLIFTKKQKNKKIIINHKILIVRLGGVILDIE